MRTYEGFLDDFTVLGEGSTTVAGANVPLSVPAGAEGIIITSAVAATDVSISLIAALTVATGGGLFLKNGSLRIHFDPGVVTNVHMWLSVANRVRYMWIAPVQTPRFR